jgi:hypothetical protein
MNSKTWAHTIVTEEGGGAGSESGRVDEIENTTVMRSLGMDIKVDWCNRMQGMHWQNKYVHVGGSNVWQLTN